MTELGAGLSLTADLRRLLANPRLPVRRRPAGEAGAYLRAAVAAADALQVVSIGLLTYGFNPTTDAAPPGTARLMALGLLAAVFAAVARRALRRGGGGAGGTGGSAPPCLAEPPVPEAVRAAVSVVFALVVVVFVAQIVPAPADAEPPRLRDWFSQWAVISGAVAAGLRLSVAGLAARLGTAVPRLVVVGAQEAAERLAAKAAGAAGRGAGGYWRLAGVFDDRAPGGLDRLADLVARGEADIVALGMGAGETARIGAVCARLADQPVRLCLALDSAALGPAALRSRGGGGLRLVELAGEPHDVWSGLCKRALDLGLASLALLLLAPLLAVIAAAIRLETPGPALFRQWRFGQGSQPIRVLKFRTMHAARGDATGAERTARRDPRVTRLGRVLRRTSIDELPQLINVLRGEMSLVGPRPHPLHMRVGDAYYFEAVAHYRTRHLVRPGLTGWAQVNGSRGEVDTLELAQRRLELDLWYIANWSVGLDLRIIARTVFGGFASMRAD